MESVYIRRPKGLPYYYSYPHYYVMIIESGCQVLLSKDQQSRYLPYRLYSRWLEGLSCFSDDGGCIGLMPWIARFLCLAQV